jgi:hypothetical protein
MFFIFNVPATVFYVDVNSTNPVPPYADWSTASTDIQSAIDAASDGDQIWVTNGIYKISGRVVYGSLTNRVVINKAVTVQSVNGPAVTMIQGYQVPGTTNGDSAVRCVYMTNNASLIGFTLTNGATRSAGDSIHEESGGGLLCEDSNTCLVSNCILSGNRGFYWVGGAYLGNFNSCTFAGNYATAAGAVIYGTLNNCVLTNNTTSTTGGGGAGAFCNFTNCTLVKNSAPIGGGAYRCTLVDCTLSNNSTYYSTSGGSGGGAINSTLIGCVITGNSAGGGGGASGGTLSNCYIADNSATGDGGLGYGGGVNGSKLNNSTLVMNSSLIGAGAYNSTLNDCLIISNSMDAVVSSTLTNCLLTGNNFAASGSIFYNCTLVANYSSNPSGTAGTSACTLYNCILYYNTAPSSTSNYLGGAFMNCCTIPLPTSGAGNFTNAPLFVNLAGGDYHLQSNSPCINAGNNVYVTTTTDLDGNPRIVGGTVDIGAYEYQTPTSIISYAWLQQYGLPTDGSVDYADLDGNGMTVYQDWIAGLNPTNALSVLQMLAPASTTNPSGLVVTWQSVSGIIYFLQSSTNLAMQPVFTTIQSNIVGQAGTTSYTDTTATNGGPYFYRVGVQ